MRIHYYWLMCMEFQIAISLEQRLDKPLCCAKSRDQRIRFPLAFLWYTKKIDKSNSIPTTC
jgi:hypothetical protein